MLSRVLLSLCLAFAGWQSGFAGVVRIADGDCSGLSSAMTAAASSGVGTTIALARNGTYSGCAINVSAGNVVIEGQGATLKDFSACVQNYSVAPGGFSLTLRNMTIGSGPDGTSAPKCYLFAGGTTGTFEFCSSIANDASLSLESVTLQGLRPSYQGCVDSAFINSTGALSFRNVSVVNSQGRLIDSSGKLEIYNSTFMGQSGRSGYDDALVSPSAYVSGGLAGGGTASIANSIFAANSVKGCANNTFVTSLGGNVATEASCGFAANAGDRIVADANLGTFGNHGGLIPTQAIDGGSPAHGAGVAQYCEALDARGYTRSPNGCDAGAYEYGGGSGALTASGLNGFYFDPDANGHYVSLQRIHDNGDIAIVWSTFDANGNQAWVYGVGQLAGKHIHAAMSQNLGGLLQPGGAPTGSSVHPWGTVDIDLTSCALAQFSYASNVPGFSSGTFPLTRLAFVSDFGCSD